MRDFLLIDHCPIDHDIDHRKYTTVLLSIEMFALLKCSGCMTNWSKLYCKVICHSELQKLTKGKQTKQITGTIVCVLGTVVFHMAILCISINLTLTSIHLVTKSTKINEVKWTMENAV